MMQTSRKISGRGDGPLFAALWMILTLVAMWRVGLALGILFNTDLVAALNSALVRWRPLDQFTGWIALVLFALTQEATARFGRYLGVVITLGALLTAAAIAWDQWGGPGWAHVAGAPGWLVAVGDRLAFLADVYMAAVAGLTIFREFRIAAPALRTGIDLLQLWRILIVQWIALWLAATIYLHLTVGKGDLLGNEAIRGILFALPALTLLPNVLMTAAIGWWAALRDRNAAAPAQVRARAWLVAMAAVNVGAVLLVIRPAFLGVAGAIFMIFGIVMFLLGFPFHIWKGAIALFATFILLAIALIMLLAERLQTISDPFPDPFFSSAWRQLLSMGVPLLFLAGAGSLALRQLLPTRYQSRAVMSTVILLVSAGIVGHALIMLIADRVGVESRSAILRWLILGPLPEAVALVVGGLLLMRTRRLVRIGKGP